MPRSRPNAPTRKTRKTRILLLLLCTGCAHHPPRSAPFASDAGRTVVTAIDADAEQAHACAVAFLTEEAQGNAAADTLLAPDADFIMTGVKVSTKPRLAGFNGPGQAVVEEANLGLAGAFAWVVMTYRFTGRVPELSERARATVILEKQRAGWRIRHVHSSMVARW